MDIDFAIIEDKLVAILDRCQPSIDCRSGIALCWHRYSRYDMGRTIERSADVEANVGSY
jgi:hypothetical protein